LAPGIVMPLHDHPEMFVLSYILNGEGEREGWNINDINTVN
jgi:cysteamine dioxygenase